MPRGKVAIKDPMCGPKKLFMWKGHMYVYPILIEQLGSTSIVLRDFEVLKLPKLAIFEVKKWL